MNVNLGDSFINLVGQTDAFSRFVLGILFGMSVLCWAIFLYKCISMWRKRRSLTMIAGHIERMTDSEDAKRYVSSMPITYGGALLSTILNAYTIFLHQNVDWKAVLDRSIRYWEQHSETLLSREEIFLPVLSTSAVVSPLLGLLGTVWGLIQAFFSIGQMQSADMAVVAPGIAQALITTLAGLMVAIPALIMYNCLVAQVRGLEEALINFGGRMFFMLETRTIQK